MVMLMAMAAVVMSGVVAVVMAVAGKPRRFRLHEQWHACHS